MRANVFQVLVEEDLGSRALFRMPDDGFATENVLGISPAFEKFLNPLMDNEAAYISVLPDPSQRWDIYLYPDHIDPATSLTAKITKVPFCINSCFLLFIILAAPISTKFNSIASENANHCKAKIAASDL